MKFLFWVISSTKGNGKTHTYLSTLFKETTDLKKALKFVDKPSAQAILEREEYSDEFVFRKEKWTLLDVTYQLKDVVKPVALRKDKHGKQYFNKGKNESIKKSSS